MKIVDRKTFLSLPAGTVYAKWGGPDDASTIDSEEVAVKGETVSGVDWVEKPFLAWPEDCHDSGQYFDAMDAAVEGTPTAPMAIGDSGCRDGLFDANQLFAVFSRLEVERLIAMLTDGLKTAYST